MDTPDWNDLRYFLAVTTAGSLSAAARSLGVEHTTVSRRIETLENVLGLRLFDRFARGWLLTEAGEGLLPQARRVEEEIQRLLRQAQGVGAGGGTVRISAPPAIAAQWIAPRLPALRMQLAGIQIELGAEPALVDLSRREADIAIRFRRPQTPDLAVRVVATVQYHLCAAPEYIASRSADEWEFIGYDESLAETPQQEWLNAFAAGRPFVFSSNDLGSIAAAVRFGAGIAALPDYLAAGLIIPDIICPVQRELWMVIHDEVRKSQRVRRTADLLAELFSTAAR
ncbi:transcriptional regulator, LysR family [Duganella sp. CF458]|uniref:LysR family transcriptional regulator n=1 Tax=Duganella sp. CF458 TaxID=1884368 RepID=UPI0008EDCA70|nr:LysR family transcriptional regulator [Duganella sp. CF458]SFF74637.1 transcriptional regulator, LysR family [Duganella sp. CF458]